MAGGAGDGAVDDVTELVAVGDQLAGGQFPAVGQEVVAVAAVQQQDRVAVFDDSGGADERGTVSAGGREQAGQQRAGDGGAGHGGFLSLVFRAAPGSGPAPLGGDGGAGLWHIASGRCGGQAAGPRGPPPFAAQAGALPLLGGQAGATRGF